MPPVGIVMFEMERVTGPVLVLTVALLGASCSCKSRNLNLN